MANKKVDIVQQYSGVINALVPFAIRGKLMVGLNKFSSRIEKDHLEEIKYEVNRLISPCNQSANNAAFAKGETTTVTIAGNEHELDEVGARILQEELQQYNKTYTQGVYEAISSEVRYKQQLDKESLDKMVKAFSVDCVIGADQWDFNQLKIEPNFPVTCDEINSGKPFLLEFLGKNEIAIELKRSPQFGRGQVLTITFPPLPKVTGDDAQVEYLCKDIVKQKGSKKLRAILEPANDNGWHQVIEAYLQKNGTRQPFFDEQEEKRSRNELIQDAIISNMPFSVTLCETYKKQLIPQYLLKAHIDTQVDTIQHGPQMSFCKNATKRMSKEFTGSREIYQFQCQLKMNGRTVTYVASLRELIRDNMLSTFIYLGQKTQSLKVLRLSLVSAADKAIQKKLLHEDNVLLSKGATKYIVFSVDVSNELDNFELTSAPQNNSLPIQYAEGEQRYDPKICIPKFSDRRIEPRYTFSGNCIIKLSWLKKVESQILDISKHGLRIKLDQALDLTTQEFKIKLPQISNQSLRYHVRSYDEKTNELRLVLSDKTSQKFSDEFDQYQVEHINQFNPHTLVAKHDNIFDSFWRIVCASIPGTHILVGQGKNAEEQLIVAQTDGSKLSLGPLKIEQDKLPTHNWFADLRSQSTTSFKLSNFLNDETHCDRSLFFINAIKGKFIPLHPDSFNGATVRQKISNAIKQKKGQFVAHSMQANDYHLLDNAWYSKRCKHLVKKDKLAVKRIKKFERQCAKIISIFPVSRLHQSLMLIGEFNPNAINPLKKSGS